MQKPKIIAIVGPTASGKSALAVRLAKKFNGEVISADSRQVYKGLDIGTGKVTARETRGIPHHLLDVASPIRQFSIARYKTLAEKTIDRLVRHHKLPILCGGTGFYVETITKGIVLPNVTPDPALRTTLGKKSPATLHALLSKLDPARARTIDRHNPRRLIRAIEIAKALGKVPKAKSVSRYDVLQIGLMPEPRKLRKKIRARLLARLRQGMVAEVRRLRSQGLSWKRMEELGLEYRYIARFLKGELSKTEMVNALETASWQYAKRQMTWFKRDNTIKWFTPVEIKRIEKEAAKFIKK